MTGFVTEYFNEVAEIASEIETYKIEEIVRILNEVKNKRGRVFVLGVGGSAGNASHMVNDLRKLAGIQTYAPTDNVSEITARTNDEGFDTIFEEYLKVSNCSLLDAIFVLSVGGGNEEKNVSVNLIKAIKYAKGVGCAVLGIVGKKDGYTAQNGDCVVTVPLVEPSRITPHSEAFQSVIWHCIVSHPNLQVNKTKW